MDTLSLLNGLRYLDSFFPSGGFAFSSGLEAAVQAGAVRNGEELSRFVEDQLRHGIGTREAVAAGLAYDAANERNLARLVVIDRELESLKLGLEGRNASRQMGRQVARTAAEHFNSQILIQNYRAAIEQDRTPGHLAVTLGVALQMAGWDKEQTIAGFLYQTAVGYNAAALKLLPIGQRESQRLLSGWTPLIEEISHTACATSTLSSWTPLHDIYAMRHSRLESRLFRS